MVTTMDQSIQTQIIQKAWNDINFKEQLLANPKAAIKEAFGMDIPDSFEIEAGEDTSKKFFVVIPPNPAKLKADESPKEAPMWP